MQSAALMSAVMGASSPQAIQAAVGGANPAFLSGEALKFANAQTGVNLGNVQAGQTIRANDANFARGQILDGREDTAYARTLDLQARADEQYARDNAQAVFAFDEWNKANATTTTAEQLVQQANSSFGSKGKAEVLTQLQNLAGKGISDEVLQAAINLANSQEILPSAGSNALTGTANSLGISTAAPAAREYDTGWAGGLLGLVDSTESGGNYNTLYGHAQRDGKPFAGTNVSRMTLDDAVQFSSKQGAYGAAQEAAGISAAPMGRFQIINSTLKGLIKEMGLSGDTLFDENVQNAMFTHLVDKRISGQDTMAGKMSALRSEWEGFKGVSDANLSAAIALYETGDRSAMDALATTQGQTTGNFGAGTGPTNANAALMAATGVNPLSADANELLAAFGGGGPRRQVTAAQTALDIAAGIPAAGGAPQRDAAGNPIAAPVSEQALRDVVEQTTAETPTEAVNTNLARTAEEPEATVALPTPEELLRQAAQPDAFPQVDPNASAYVQDRQQRQRDSTINNAIAELTGSVGGGAFAPITNSVNGLLDYFSQTSEQSAKNVETRAINDAAGTTLANNADFFRQNPDEIAVARDNPVEYAQNFGNTPAQKAFLESRQAPAAATTTATASTDASAPAAQPRADMTPQERALADRTDSLAPLKKPDVLASENTEVPIGDTLNTLIAQGTADQTANIYGALDRLVANPPTEGTDPESVARAMYNQQDGLGDGEKVAYNDILNSVNTLMASGGVTAPMAAEIIKYSMDTGGRAWTPNRWFGGNKQINMETAEATRKAYLGTKEDGTVNTAPATRALERAQQVQTAMTNLQNLKTQYDEVVAAVKAASVDPAYSDTMRADLAQTAQLILDKIRADTQKIEATGILSNYSQRQSN
jgi:hypothetical protein